MLPKHLPIMPPHLPILPLKKTIMLITHSRLLPMTQRPLTAYGAELKYLPSPSHLSSPTRRQRLEHLTGHRPPLLLFYSSSALVCQEHQLTDFVSHLFPRVSLDECEAKLS